ncbi:hypothetical protein GCM10023084_54590 [Streptomyces lacrimifluminis]|uniref:Antitoxin n=1 Tax=Streptomyces lacrimifluminis TaxID=1500077 RepID=A0A917NW04_9ACTN|nr:hypothetical protein GCM10012282_33270 [Streptomyces lacrimifluminis]
MNTYEPLKPRVAKLPGPRSEQAPKDRNRLTTGLRPAHDRPPTGPRPGDGRPTTGRRPGDGPREGFAAEPARGRSPGRSPRSGACHAAEEVVITRAGHEPVVIVSLEDYESLKETAYLLRSPANARRLLASIDELESAAGPYAS